MRGTNFLAMAAICAAGITLTAAEFSAAKLADWNIGKSQAFTATQEGFICKTAKTRIEILTKEMMPVSADKKYRLSGSARLPEGCSESGFVWLGLKCFDKDGKEIESAQCNGIPGTMTELAKAVKAGDKEIFLKDASKWKLEYTHIAFGAKADWSDCPNKELSPSVKAIAQEGGIWKLTLASPMKKAYPAGTAVRYHRDGATYIYVYCEKPKAGWKNFKIDYQGFYQTNAVNSARKFRPGTASVQMIIFTESKPCAIEFKNIAITEVK